MELLINFMGRKISLSAYKAYLACKARVEAARTSGFEPDPKDEYEYLKFLGAMTNDEKKKRYEVMKAKLKGKR